MTKYERLDSCNLENWSQRTLNNPVLLFQLTLFTFCISLTLKSNPAQFHVLASTFSPSSTNTIPNSALPGPQQHSANKPLLPPSLAASTCFLSLP